MSGNPARQRTHAAAKAAAKYADEGYTHRQIADMIGIQPASRIKGLVLLGRRLLYLPPATSPHDDDREVT